ncbi:YqgE/AlgH family protein [Tautonia plasticadhaerens]|uniref:Uncharacterized protein n=1 Tax=Tautonia plasticadhaerens TaxID=2527974 RepID=A0A518H9G3_9BACT|nr:YqgE/AlgH family protein [Tautonia plasticadhaerens]QDV37483.1 hypothetical protein ElP_54230 [Tautonia plasticadhaerens]
MKSLKGHFLVASRSLADPNFVRTVLLMIEHTDAGAAGIVLNRPTGASLAEVSEEAFGRLVEWDKPIHLGGPVPGPLIALHSLEGLGDQEVLDGLFSTVDPDKLQELIRLRVEPSRFLANYAGWGAGQLEMELDQDSWIISPADPEVALRGGDVSMWEEVLKHLSASLLADALGLDQLPDDPSLN